MEVITILQSAGMVLLLTGAVFVLIGSFGVWRMPDFFTRLHPASLSDSLGLPLVIVGVALQGDYGMVTFKLLLLIAFAMITSATASHALAKAALAEVAPVAEAEKNPVQKKSVAQKSRSKKL